MRAHQRFGRIPYFIFFLVSALFVVTLHIRPYPFDYLVKSIPVFCLCLPVLAGLSGKKKGLFAAGFLFSGIGDLILELGQGRFFIQGLLAFLGAHIFYLTGFATGFKVRPPAVRAAAAGGLLLSGLVLGFRLAPALGEMTLAVMVYLCVILLMGITACLAVENHALTIVGAACFLLSDTLLAVNKFVTPLPGSDYLVMITYYTAQFLICMGVLRSVSKNVPQH